MECNHTEITDLLASDLYTQFMGVLAEFHRRPQRELVSCHLISCLFDMAARVQAVLDGKQPLDPPIQASLPRLRHRVWQPSRSPTLD